MILELIQATPGGNLDVVVSALQQRGLAAGKCGSGRCVGASDGKYVYLFTYSDISTWRCTCRGYNIYQNDVKADTSTVGGGEVRGLCETSMHLDPSLAWITDCSCDIRFKDGTTDSAALAVSQQQRQQIETFVAQLRDRQKMLQLAAQPGALQIRVIPTVPIPYYYAERLVGYSYVKGASCTIGRDASQVPFPRGVKIAVTYEESPPPRDRPPKRETVVYDGRIVGFNLVFSSRCGDKACVFYVDPAKSIIEVLRPKLSRSGYTIVGQEIIAILNEPPEIKDVTSVEAVYYQMPIQLIGNALGVIGGGVYDRLASCILQPVAVARLDMQFTQNIRGRFQFDPWSITADVGKIKFATWSGQNVDQFECQNPPCTFTRTGVLEVEGGKFWDLINSGGRVNANFRATYFPPGLEVAWGTTKVPELSITVNIPFSFTVSIPPEAIEEAKRIYAMLKGNNPPPDTGKKLNELTSGGTGGGGIVGTGTVAPTVGTQIGTAVPTAGTQLAPTVGGTAAPTVGTQMPPGGGGGGPNVQPDVDKITDMPSLPNNMLQLVPGQPVTLRWRGANRYRWTFTVGTVYLVGPVSDQIALNSLVGQTQQDTDEVSATLRIGADAAQAYNTLKSLGFTIYMELIVQAQRAGRGVVGEHTFYVVI